MSDQYENIHYDLQIYDTFRLYILIETLGKFFKVNFGTFYRCALKDFILKVYENVDKFNKCFLISPISWLYRMCLLLYFRKIPTIKSLLMCILLTKYRRWAHNGAHHDNFVFPTFTFLLFVSILDVVGPFVSYVQHIYSTCEIINW